MKKITIAIAGLGSRGRTAYGKELLDMKDRAKVVAIADINKARRDIMAQEHSVSADMVFESAEKMLEMPKLADAMIICTQDRQHVGHAIAALRKGYDILLEKPISPFINELREIVKVAKEENRIVIVCHVLRYTPFFRAIKTIIGEGKLGEIISIQALENVRYWHQAHSFVRGNWRSSEDTSPMILAKCCHDLDYLIWLTGQRCERVSSFGSLKYFKKENAPEGAALRCLEGCKAKDKCPYDAEKIYLTNEDTGVLNGNVEWPCDVLSEHPDKESIYNAIKTGPYGRCVFHCDNDVVDNQVVNLQMENGISISFIMGIFTSTGGRTIKIMGTHGDLWADMDENIIKLGIFGQKHEVIDIGKIAKDFAGHGGGDRLIVKQFLDIMEGLPMSPETTTLETSVESHLVALAAEESRLANGKSIEIVSLRG